MLYFCTLKTTQNVYIEKKGYEDIKGEKTLDNPDDGNHTDSRRRFGGRKTILSDPGDSGHLIVSNVMFYNST